MNKLLEYEKRLLEYRAELNDLIHTYSSNDTCDKKLVECKIDYLKKELSYMEQQLDILKSNLSAASSEVKSTAPRADVSVPPNPTSEKNHPSNTYYSSTPYKPAYTSSVLPNKKQTTKDFENLMGKSLMGIFASVLIFISLIFFATLVLPYLNDTLKMILMYAISFTFMIAGLFLLKKDGKNKLSLSITGCGSGAVYISLLVSNLYFKALNDIALYFFIFVWAMFICFLSRKKSFIFQIIGQYGIFIAITFGAVLCSEGKDWNKFLFLVFFFVVTEIVFFLSHMQKEYQKNIINHAANILCLFIFAMNMPHYFQNSEAVITFSYVVLLLFILMNMLIGFMKLKVDEKSELIFTVTNICYFCLLCKLFVFDYKPLMIMILSLIVLKGIAWKFKEGNNFGVILLQGFFMLLLAISMYRLKDIAALRFITEYLSLAILIIPFAIYGYHKKDKVYKICSFIYLLLFLFPLSMNNNAHFIIGFALFLLLAYLLKFTDQYNTKTKILLYCMFYIFLLRDLSILLNKFDFHYLTNEFIIFMVMSTLNILAAKTPFSRNWITGEPEQHFQNTANIINSIWMMISLPLISAISDSLQHIFVILMTLVLFMMNSKNLLKRKNMAYGIYVGIKFTLLMIVILNSYDSPNYIISIACFLFAIGSIICGFQMNFKSLRVYGLVLSLLSIAKLILLDMDYENTLGRAFSFFICGILCFVISTIYNFVDKKINSQQMPKH